MQPASASIQRDFLGSAVADLVGDIHDCYWVDSSSYRDSWPYGLAEALTSNIVQVIRHYELRK